MYAIRSYYAKHSLTANEVRHFSNTLPMLEPARTIEVCTIVEAQPQAVNQFLRPVRCDRTDIQIPFQCRVQELVKAGRQTGLS